jgi:hypothetical protein
MSSMSRYGHVEDVDLEAGIAAGPMHIPATDATYETTKKKVRDFLGLAVGAHVPAELLTDTNIAAFLLVMGEVEQWKPHFKKAAQAAIGSLIKKARTPGLFDRPDLYTSTHLILQEYFNTIKLLFTNY